MSPDRRWPAALPGSRQVLTLQRPEELKLLRGHLGTLGSQGQDAAAPVGMASGYCRRQSHLSVGGAGVG